MKYNLDKLTTREKEVLLNYFYPHKIDEKIEYKKRMIERNLTGRTVLDAGVGSGWLSLYLHQRGFEIIGIDLSEKCLYDSKFLFEIEKATIPLILCPVDKLCFHDKTFSAVLLLEILEHLPDCVSTLAEVNRVLTDNGRLFVSIPNGWTFGLIYDRLIFGGSDTPNFEKGSSKDLREIFRKLGMKYVDYEADKVFGHLHQFSIFSIKNILRQNGFMPIKTYNLGFLSPYINSFMCTILKMHPNKTKLINKLDQKIAPFVPQCLASGWLIVCRKNNNQDEY
ncbi:MAG: class I SAM-dependent methyltransferase [bacterium]|nr:class I SAM-dependent methyltransferase [bacterium]